MMKYPLNVIHFSPHLGGGVGQVLLNYLFTVKEASRFNHTIFCFDSINNKAKNFLEAKEISYKEKITDVALILEEIVKTDIVVIHWWNHPLLYDFLVRISLPPCRVVFWSHVSGHEPPQVFSHTLFDYPDFFIFTTPMSYMNKSVSTYQGDFSKFQVIWSTGGLEHIQSVKPICHDSFCVGYIGTIDFSKMYPHFISMCSKIHIPNIQFIVCGDGGDLDAMKTEVIQKNLQDKFIFTGYVEDVANYLGLFDVFGYPLNSNHYGTCDQVLAEAMGCGIVPVVFGNNMESYMVHNSYNGFVVKTEEEYIQAILTLYDDKRLREHLGSNAKEEAFRRFSIKETVLAWEKTYIELMRLPKKARKWSGKYSGVDVKAYQVFLESIGTYADVFESANQEKITELMGGSHSWSSPTKGTPAHYNYFFVDSKLQSWNSYK